VVLEWFWGGSGVVWGWFCDGFGMGLEWFWDGFGVVLDWYSGILSIPAGNNQRNPQACNLYIDACREYVFPK
jgi:hypothetical protein